MNDTKPASGRFLLRLDPGLHAALRAASRQAGLSLNDYCARKLAAPGCRVEGPAGPAVEQAARLLGESLIGIVVYGSWARGESTEASDVDLLVVVDPGAELNRELYRRWDAAPLAWESRPVEPHFVRLPEPGRRVSGLWAEAAVDGWTIFERGEALSRWLAEVRRRIAAGEIMRREIHGQPYWVEAA